MELIDSLTFSRVSRILNIPKEELFEDACDDLLSLAIRVYSTDPLLYENSEGVAGKQEGFDYSGAYQYVYLYGNFLAANKEMILSSGELPLANIVNFNKYPIGHSKRENQKSMYSLNIYEGDKLPYKKWRYEYMWQRLNIKAQLYITRDAMLHSAQDKYSISNIDNAPVDTGLHVNEKYLKHVDELVSWSGSGQTQRIVTTCWESFIQDDTNQHYPVSADALLEYSKNRVGLKAKTGEFKGDNELLLNGSDCKWTSFKRLANELIKQAKK